MSTWETNKFKQCDCPCKAGQITKTIESADNPWSRADISYSLDCEECVKNWRLEHGSLILRSSESEYDSLSKRRLAIQKELVSLASTIVTSYFKKAGVRTKKAEHSGMQELGIFSGTYQSYLRSRRETDQLGDIAYGLGNKKWLLSIADETEKKIN